MVWLWLNSLALTGGLVTSEEDNNIWFHSSMCLVCNRRLPNSNQNEFTRSHPEIPHTYPPTSVHNRLNPLPDIVLSHTNPDANCDRKKLQRRQNSKKTQRRVSNADGPNSDKDTSACDSKDADDLEWSKIQLLSTTTSDEYLLDYDHPHLRDLRSEHARSTSRSHTTSARNLGCMHCYPGNNFPVHQALMQDIGFTLKCVGDEFQTTYVTNRLPWRRWRNAPAGFSPREKGVIAGCLVGLLVLEICGVWKP